MSSSKNDCLQHIEDFMNSDQARVCVSSSPHIMIEGVAGSRKTDTMIRLGLRRHLREKKNLLFLTQIGSVTDEIRIRVGNYLKQTIYKFGSSNHFLLENGDFGTIEIANFDAWVHRQLEDCQWSSLKTMGAFHHFKCKSLLEMCIEQPASIKGFSLKNGTYADEILVDECQDFEEMKANLLTHFLRLCPWVRSVFAGDKMQTLFEHSIIGEHPMTVFDRLLPTRFHLNKCFRCPKSHIEFSNRILRNSFKKYGCKEMVPIQKSNSHKPFLFPHGSVSKKFEVHQLVRQLIHTLAILCVYDPSIVPSDVCFLMRKSNDQKVFDFLRNELETFWSQKGYTNSVIHFATQHDGFRTPIQWEFAENKTCLISIHGDKGKGHKVVFFLGLSQGSLPEECALFKDRELIFESLLNVALTRSTKYLFVGFHFSRPSQYIFQNYQEIKSYCVCSWDIQPHTPKLYQAIAKLVHFPSPQFDKMVLRHQPVQVPSLWPISIKDAVRSFERVEDLLGYYPKIQTTSFGKKLKTMDIPPDILSNTAGIMLWYLVNPDSFFQEIERWFTQPILFTKNDRLVCLVKDYELNRYVGTPCFMEKLHEVKETIHVDILKPLEETPGYVLSDWISPFLPLISNCRNTKKEIPLEVWFPLSFYFSEIRGEHCKPVEIPASFRTDLLFQNVVSFVNSVSKQLEFFNHHDIRAIITDESKISELGFSKEKDQRIFQHGFSFGISAISDLLDLESQTLYLLKSNAVELTKEWILLASLCSCLPAHKGMETNHVGLVNFILGKVYIWEKPRLAFKSVLHKIMRDFPEDMIQLLWAVNYKKICR
jgi:hypothetical protein